MGKNLSSLLSEQVALLVEYKSDWEKRGNLSIGRTGRSYVATTPMDFFKAQQRQEGVPHDPTAEPYRQARKKLKCLLVRVTIAESDRTKSSHVYWVWLDC